MDKSQEIKQNKTTIHINMKKGNDPYVFYLENSLGFVERRQSLQVQKTAYETTEPHREKSRFLPRRKQRRRSASR